MADMLVNLLKLPPVDGLNARLAGEGIVIRRAQPWEQSAVRRFVLEHFSENWADEISVAYAAKPVSLYLATQERRPIGFGAYECTRRCYFGPTGVAASCRGKGVGTALLLACLHGLRELGYAYGIIGGVGPAEFYRKAVGAVPIADSTPGIYTDMLKPPTG